MIKDRLKLFGAAIFVTIILIFLSLLVGDSIERIGNNADNFINDKIDRITINKCK